MKSNKNNTILMSFIISRLTLLLGMACNASPKERVQAQVLIQKELSYVQSQLEYQHIHNICSWLDLFECLDSISSTAPSLPSHLLHLHELYEEFRTSESPAFNHPDRSAAEILTELFLYGHAISIANPSIRKRCRIASNYYIDHCGAHPLIFRQARVSLSISVPDVNRWYAHKSWVWLMDDPLPYKIE
ncbi:MAG: hypothetical protein WDZ91_08185 [Paenibacillaceae bacterium]